ncbi:hypothetical protein HYN48_04935 [Flavobacterium magnum]|uniref:Alkyl hydroperoxide reductase subunit C/ Thiol specific antioxidant domain-containing protein n=1 Tax=Flavobacterium magnum TaxID=2162713 RepID=A0A2S0RCZ7_9FLAO|nr:hypothetical protein [Flavobacterium magnum]AWA29485.1 hypothetical protein HYN48_04935 [Flavobacterium magnum]
MGKIVIGVVLSAICYAAIHIILLNVGGSSIPDFKYYSLEGKVVGKEILTQKKKTVFLYALPDCDICASELNKVNLLRAQSDFNLVVIFPFDQSVHYSQNEPPIQSLRADDAVLIDRDDRFQSDFGLGIVAEFPTLLLYDETDQFVSKYRQVPDKI